MLQNLVARMALSLLFIIPIDSEIERSTCLTILTAWHEDYYHAYNEAEEALFRKKLIVRVGHGSGYTYRLTQEGREARIAIKRILGL